MRVYGAPIKPHVSPREVPDRIDFLEIVWQLNESDKIHLRNNNKGSFTPPNLYFSNFKIMRKEGLDLVYFKLLPYQMAFKKFRNYNSEHLIHHTKVGVKLKGLDHEQDQISQDLITNATFDVEVQKIRETWVKVQMTDVKMIKIDTTKKGAHIYLEDMCHDRMIINFEIKGEEVDSVRALMFNEKFMQSKWNLGTLS